MDRAIELIQEKREKEKNRVIKSFKEDTHLQILNGRWGPYIAFKKKNYPIPKKDKERAKDLTLKDCMEIIDKKDKKTK